MTRNITVFVAHLKSNRTLTTFSGFTNILPISRKVRINAFLEPEMDKPKKGFIAFDLSGYLTNSICVLGSGLKTELMAIPLFNFSFAPETAQSVSELVRTRCPSLSDNLSAFYIYTFASAEAPSILKCRRILLGPLIYI